MFATAQQVNNPGGLEITADAARADDVRAAAGSDDKEKKQGENAEPKRLAETTEAGRGAAGAAASALPGRLSPERGTRFTKKKSRR
jgi:hypothetical protein